uniref:Uncharacterized protein n=1 Tax=Nelumbo nucifera TaxID=4432 RepID=A0A823A0M6_NELNU|nr:TPA_asm: hypothetical protein HUJ06_018533 [Nelumbo nucifera]
MMMHVLTYVQMRCQLHEPPELSMSSVGRLVGDLTPEICGDLSGFRALVNPGTSFFRSSTLVQGHHNRIRIHMTKKVAQNSRKKKARSGSQVIELKAAPWTNGSRAT